MVIKIPNQACKAGEACEACQTHFLIKIFRIIKKTRIGRFGAPKIIQEKLAKVAKIWSYIKSSCIVSCAKISGCSHYT